MKKRAYVKSMKVGDLVSCMFDPDDVGIITDCYEHRCLDGSYEKVATVHWVLFRTTTQERLDDGLRMLNSC